MTQARARATSVSVDANTITDPAKFQQYQAAQNQLSGVLGRLLSVQEAYPDLKSNANFMALQSQLEGTENRINVARNDYNEAVRDYNTTLRTFPQAIWAKTAHSGSKPMQLFTGTAAAQSAPTVDFGAPGPASAPGVSTAPRIRPAGIVRRAGRSGSMTSALRLPRAFLAWAAVLVCLFGGAAYAADPTFPALSGRVVDSANVLSPEVESDLTAKLQALESKTGRQLVVVTVPSLQGDEIERLRLQVRSGLGHRRKRQERRGVVHRGANRAQGARRGWLRPGGNADRRSVQRHSPDPGPAPFPRQ